jgi:hypothetical protein
MTKRNGTLFNAVAASGGSGNILTPTDYAIGLLVQITIAGTPTGPASFAYGLAFGDGIGYGFPAIYAPLAAGTYVWQISLPDAITLFSMSYSAASSGGSSTITASWGSCLP